MGFLITFYLVLFLVNTFAELARILIQKEGAKFLLSEKFLCNKTDHFARHRKLVGCNGNPTQAQFAQQEIALSVISSNLISDARGNTEGPQGNREYLKPDDMHLSKKRPLNKR